MKLYIYLFILIAFIVSSCKTTERSNSSELDKETSKYIYLFSEANKYRLLGDNEKAKQNYLSAIEVNNKSAVSNFYLAVIFSAEKQYHTALKFAENAVKLQPDNIWYKLVKADMYSLTANFDPAIDIYEELFNDNSQNDIYFERLEKIFIEKNDDRSLIDLYEKYSKLNGVNNDVGIKLYELYRRNNKINEAENILKKLSDLNYDQPKYTALLAEFYLSIHNIPEAEGLYKILINKYPENKEVLLSYSYYCKLTGRSDEYYISVKKLMSSELDINTKINLIISGQYPNFPKEEYFELLNLLYEEHKDEIQANTLFAEYYIDNNEIEKAVIYVKNAVDLDNNNFNLILTLFELYYDSRNFKELYLESEKIKSIYPNRPKIFLYNGIAAYEIEKYNDAVQTLLMGKDLLIDDKLMEIQFNFYLAESYKKLKNYKKSDEFFEETLKLNENYKPAMISYSVNLSIRNINLEKAKDLAEKCYSQNKEDIVFQYAYALVLFKMKNYEEAKTVSDISIKNSDNPVYLELYGDILFCVNMKTEAVNYWKMAKEKGSQNTQLENKINNYETLKTDDL